VQEFRGSDSDVLWPRQSPPSSESRSNHSTTFVFDPPQWRVEGYAGLRAGNLDSETLDVFVVQDSSAHLTALLAPAAISWPIPNLPHEALRQLYDRALRARWQAVCCASACNDLTFRVDEL
jgi:hypothetical protein